MSTRVNTRSSRVELYLHPDAMRAVLNSPGMEAELGAQAQAARERAVAIASSQVASPAQVSAFSAGVTVEVVDSDSLGVDFDSTWGLGNRAVGVVRQSTDEVVRVVGGRTQAFKGALGSMGD